MYFFKASMLYRFVFLKLWSIGHMEMSFHRCVLKYTVVSYVT